MDERAQKVKPFAHQSKWQVTEKGKYICDTLFGKGLLPEYIKNFNNLIIIKDQKNVKMDKRF